MTYTELIAAVAEKANVPKATAQAVLSVAKDVIVDGAAKDGSVAYAGFGTFKVSDVPAKTGRNPHTGEAIEIPAKKKLAYKASTAVKRDLNP